MDKVSINTMVDEKVDSVTRDLVRLYVKEKKELMDVFPVDQVAVVAEYVWQAYLNGRTVFACGNGGNAAFAANMITDFSMHPFVSEDKGEPLGEDVPRLRGVNLAESPTLITAVTNDLGPQEIFSQLLLINQVGAGDVVFGFSGSGNSQNILEAFNVAKRHQAVSVAITRGTGGKMRELADLTIIIPGISSFPGQTGGNNFNFHYEDALSSVAHIITGILKQRVQEKFDVV